MDYYSLSNGTIDTASKVPMGNFNSRLTVYAKLSIPIISSLKSVLVASA